MCKTQYLTTIVILFIFAVLREEFRTEPVDSMAVTGEVAILECEPPRGHPPPIVKWMKDEMMIEPDDRIRLMPDGNLMISEVCIIGYRF